MSTKRIGSRKVAKKIQNVWTEEDIKMAMHECKSVPGVKVRAIAKKYGVNECTLRFRLKKEQNQEDLFKAGRRCVFNEETEADLARCIGMLCNLGFSPTTNEILVSLKL